MNGIRRYEFKDMGDMHAMTEKQRSGMQKENNGLVRDPEIRSQLHGVMSEVICEYLHANSSVSADILAEHILSGLEKLGWHGVKE